MTIIHRYITRQIVRNVLICSAGFCFLFLMIDFFDRIDNIITEDASIPTVLKYFMYKIPLFFDLTLPVAMLIGTLFTIGILARNSEITAMRAAGLKVSWIARPVFVLALALSLLSLILGETIIPFSARRVREIYNIDIKEKHKTGTYSRSDIWWRDGSQFFSVNMFDSRDNTLHNLSMFDVGRDFTVASRVDARKAQWVHPLFGWTMRRVHKYRFDGNTVTEQTMFDSLALPISETPKDFYSAKTDVQTMSYSELRHFIRTQIRNGINTAAYYADLYAKLAFPLVIFFAALVVLPFALKPARSGSIAVSFLAGIAIAFTWFALHSLSLALGRAEIWPPLLAAWMANIIMGIVGVILNLGAEAPG